MLDQNITQIELTGLDGKPITLSADFEISSGECASIYYSDLEEKREIDSYIREEIEKRGLNLSKLNLAYEVNSRRPYRADYGPMTGLESQIFSHVKAGCTLLQSKQPKFHSGLMTYDSTTWLPTVRAERPRYHVIQTEDEIKQALSQGVVSLHNPDKYYALRQEWLSAAKGVIDHNLDRIQANPEIGKTVLERVRDLFSPRR
ncbi:MAG: hypothetical protein R3D88_08300 [Alphaproteobacteria bacterium]|nr:hypothetical protein [Alphaproteobacteria bacterium]